MLSFLLHPVFAEQNTENFGAESGSVVGEGAENAEDEISILADQDQVRSPDLDHPEVEDQARQGILSLEDEPVEFIRGEVDVVEQINRTERAQSWVNQSGKAPRSTT